MESQALGADRTWIGGGSCLLLGEEKGRARNAQAAAACLKQAFRRHVRGWSETLVTHPGVPCTGHTCWLAGPHLMVTITQQLSNPQRLRVPPTGPGPSPSPGPAESCWAWD